MNFRPSVPFVTAMRLLIPVYTTVKGVPVKEFPDPSDAPVIFGTFRSFGGTEMNENDLYTVVATGYIDTWYRPDIQSECRIQIIETGAVYEVLGDPEDIQMRHQYIKMRVQKVGGKA